jgi:two-component system response regulator FixJ
MTIRYLYIVDDDDIVRTSLPALMDTQSDLETRDFASGDEFLDAVDEIDPGCVLLDLDMPGSDGITVLRAIARYPGRFAAVILTGKGQIADAVYAMKAGAVDFLEKPSDHRKLVDVVNAAFVRLSDEHRDIARRDAARAKLALLSAREQEVLHGMIEGLPNKLIAHKLEISPRTVEIYRSKLMEKLKVRSLSEALRIGFAAGIVPEV